MYNFFRALVTIIVVPKKNEGRNHLKVFSHFSTTTPILITIFFLKPEKFVSGMAQSRFSCSIHDHQTFSVCVFLFFLHSKLTRFMLVFYVVFGLSCFFFVSLVYFNSSIFTRIISLTPQWRQRDKYTRQSAVAAAAVDVIHYFIAHNTLIYSF